MTRKNIKSFFCFITQSLLPLLCASKTIDRWQHYWVSENKERNEESDVQLISPKYIKGKKVIKEFLLKKCKGTKSQCAREQK